MSNPEKTSIQPSFDTNRQVLGEIYPLRTPFNVIIDSSEACNFRCNYCFRADSDKKNWSYAADQRIMNFETFKKAFKQSMQFPDEVKQISLSNHGEPLCNRNLPQMVRYMREHSFGGRISIHTNASLLDKKYAEELGEAGLSRIVISLQGLNSEKYMEVSGACIDFDAFKQNIGVLYESSKRNKDFETQICIKVADVALEECEKDVFYEKFSPIADRVFVENIVPIWKNNVVEGESHYNKFGQYFSKQRCCPLVFHTIVITPDGDVYPCTQLIDNIKLGNICKESLIDMWNGSRRREILRNVLNLEAPEMCRDCYILQNSIYTKEDMIDDYRLDILNRL